MLPACEKAAGPCVPLCAQCDPLCAPIEKGLYCGLLQCVEGGRPFVLMIGALLAGLQLADMLTEDYEEPKDQPRTKPNELALDLCTGIFYLLGSYAVYHTSKHFASPIMRFGLFLIALRLVDFFLFSGAWRNPYHTDPWCHQQITTCEGRREGSPDDIHNLKIDRTATCHYPCHWVCHNSVTGEEERCRYTEEDATLPGGGGTVKVSVAENQGSCHVMHVDDHDMTEADCIYNANSFNAGNMLYVQLTGQVFYCWLLNAFSQKKKEGLLAAAETVTADATGPVSAPQPEAQSEV